MYFTKQFFELTLPDAIIKNDLLNKDAGFSVDSRLVQEGDIFVALKGNVNDGHQFIEEALSKGATGIIAEKSQQKTLDAINSSLLKDKFIVLVDDTLQALWKLAKAWRSQFNYPVIGITGSFGKTSTKEILSNVLKLHGKNALVSKGNQNSVRGLPLNILKMRSEHDIAVFELGINKREEMSKLVEMVKPTIGIITAVGHAHMEGLGSLSDIAAEKREIFKYFTESNIGIINGDQEPLSQIGYTHPVIRFGTKTTNQIQARKIRVSGSDINFVLKIYKQKYNVTLKSNHLGAVFNALAATSVGCLLNIPNDVIVKGIQVPIAIEGRFNMKPLKIGKGTLIDDCYNASPESMKAALLAFEEIDTGAQKIAVLGDMLELGVDSPFWHRQIGRFLRKVPSLDHLILVGELVDWTKKTAPIGLTVQLVSNWEQAVDALSKKVTKESMVLVKGSTRGHKEGLVRLVNYFTNDKQENNQPKDVELSAQFIGAIQSTQEI